MFKNTISCQIRVRRCFAWQDMAKIYTNEKMGVGKDAISKPEPLTIKLFGVIFTDQVTLRSSRSYSGRRPNIAFTKKMIRT